MFRLACLCAFLAPIFLVPCGAQPKLPRPANPATPIHVAVRELDGASRAQLVASAYIKGAIYLAEHCKTKIDSGTPLPTGRGFIVELVLTHTATRPWGWWPDEGYISANVRFDRVIERYEWWPDEIQFRGERWAIENRQLAERLRMLWNLPSDFVRIGQPRKGDRTFLAEIIKAVRRRDADWLAAHTRWPMPPRPYGLPRPTTREELYTLVRAWMADEPAFGINWTNPQSFLDRRSRGAQLHAMIRRPSGRILGPVSRRIRRFWPRSRRLPDHCVQHPSLSLRPLSQSAPAACPAPSPQRPRPSEIGAGLAPLFTPLAAPPSGRPSSRRGPAASTRQRPQGAIRC